LACRSQLDVYRFKLSPAMAVRNIPPVPQRRWKTKGMRIGSYVRVVYQAKWEPRAEWEGIIVDKRVGGQDRESWVELKDALQLSANREIVGRSPKKRLIDAFIRDCEVVEKREEATLDTAGQAPCMMPLCMPMGGMGGMWPMGMQMQMPGFMPMFPMMGMAGMAGMVGMGGCMGCVGMMPGAVPSGCGMAMPGVAMPAAGPSCLGGCPGMAIPPAAPSSHPATSCFAEASSSSALCEVPGTEGPQLSGMPSSTREGGLGVIVAPPSAATQRDSHSTGGDEKYNSVITITEAARERPRSRSRSRT